MCLPGVSTVIQFAPEVLANLINADKRIKRMQIGDHEIKIVHFTDNATIFLRDITWGPFQKVCSRFPSFEPLSPPLFSLVRFQPPPTSPPQFLYLRNLDKIN